MENNEFVSLVKIQELPFFYGLLDKTEINGQALPRFLPFDWGVDLQKGLYRQRPNSSVSKAISCAYLSTATIAPPTGEGDFGKQWSSTVIGVLKGLFTNSFDGQKILEIGCSNGLLLSELAAMGALCTGIEPGPQAEMSRQRHGIDIHRCYFEQFESTEKFDFIYAVNVLEHVADLDVFFGKLTQVLKPGGVFVAAVPDSALEMGALSPNIFVHEHYWYFNKESLVNFMEHIGFREIRAQKSTFGSNFFVCGRLAGSTAATPHPAEKPLKNEAMLAEGKVFARELSAFLESLQGRINTLSGHGNGCIGLYGASNAINFLGMLDWETRPRIFDTDRHNRGRYLWSRQHPQLIVEAPTPDALESTSEIWILPVAHQTAIENYLLQLGVSRNSIRTYSELRSGQ